MGIFGRLSFKSLAPEVNFPPHFSLHPIPFPIHVHCMLSVNAAVTDLPFYMIFFFVVVGREVQCSWLWVCKAEIIIYYRWGIIFIHLIIGG